MGSKTKYKFDKKVLAALPPLTKGSHKDTDAEVCAMEALARSCGLGTTDHPECASEVIGSFCRRFNDDLPTDEHRDRLIRPLLPLMVGTADDGHDQERGWMFADSAVRVFAANAMEHAGLNHEAKVLRALKPITDEESARSAAESAAWSAAWSAESAAQSAAWSAWSAARSAARSAESAARSAKKEVEYQLAADLLKRICEVGQ